MINIKIGRVKVAERIYWATGLSLTTPFTEMCPGAKTKPLPLAVIRNWRLNSVACLAPVTAFSSIQRVRGREIEKEREEEKEKESEKN